MSVAERLIIQIVYNILNNATMAELSQPLQQAKELLRELLKEEGKDER